VREPVEWLASQEDIYWAISHALRAEQKRLGNRRLKVLDLGCGLGYLTYALNRAGYDCCGVDVSSVATDEARKRYGDHFLTAPIESLSSVIKERYDVVIMAELIEHLQHPLEAMRHAWDVLRSDGAMIITTPNRDAFEPKCVWASDPPPVHLWFFSEVSIGFMARKTSCIARFINFHPYNLFHFLPRNGRFYKAPHVHEILDEHGSPARFRGGGTHLGRILRAMHVYAPITLLRSILQETLTPSSRRPSLCAVLKRDVTDPAFPIAGLLNSATTVVPRDAFSSQK
jgi:SAM-dependent methyltransferase